MSEVGAPTSYGELAEVLGQLGLLVREARRVRRLSVNQAGAQMGLNASTVMRLEAGQAVHVDTARAVLRWLDAGPRA